MKTTQHMLFKGKLFRSTVRLDLLIKHHITEQTLLFISPGYISSLIDLKLKFSGLVLNWFSCRRSSSAKFCKRNLTDLRNWRVRLESATLSVSSECDIKRQQ